MKQTLSNTTEQKPLTHFAEKAYLDYAMYVILDRALPHIEDGLKPVQRRIIYAMSEMGLTNQAKFKKSARTVGDVLGKYHPHGDMACYEAMVLMAQSFSYRYPLIEGQGNWGTADDPKSFAAMRYTEARLTPYTAALLTELPQGTVDWIPNFDGTLKEPSILPARLPNVLLNGASGIAVGMSTDIPPHNLNEVASACIQLLDNPQTDLPTLCQHIQGPDFPTKAEIITPKNDIQQIYQNGYGSLRARAVYHQEKNGDVVITALPYQTSGNKVLSQIANQMKAKKLPMVADLRDESDHQNPTRFVLTPKSKRIDVQALMDHLFATTDLEQSYRVNFNMIGTDGRPQVKNLKTILLEWLEFRKATVTKRLQHRLAKVEARLHILEGLLVAYLNLDEVIRIIREEDHPKQVLQKQFNLTETQADAILELKLRHLARLEQEKIANEQKERLKEKRELEALLNSKQKLRSLIQKELQEDASQYGDSRCSPLIERHQAQPFKEDQTVPEEPVTVVLSKKGWARMAKGHDINPETLNYKAGDHFLAAAYGLSTQKALFIDTLGRSYTITLYQLPSARSQGEPLTTRINLSAGSQLVSVIMAPSKAQYVLANTQGYGFRVHVEDLITKNKNGKAIMTLPTGAQILSPIPIDTLDSSHIVLVTQSGRMLVYPCTELPLMKRGKGNKLIQLKQDILKYCQVIAPQQTLILQAGKRTLKLGMNEIQNYIGKRSTRGRLLPRGFRKVQSITKDVINRGEG